MFSMNFACSMHDDVIREEVDHEDTLCNVLTVREYVYTCHKVSINLGCKVGVNSIWMG